MEPVLGPLQMSTRRPALSAAAANHRRHVQTTTTMVLAVTDSVAFCSLLLRAGMRRTTRSGSRRHAMPGLPRQGRRSKTRKPWGSDPGFSGREPFSPSSVGGRGPTSKQQQTVCVPAGGTRSARRPAIKPRLAARARWRKRRRTTSRSRRNSRGGRCHRVPREQRRRFSVDALRGGAAGCCCCCRSCEPSPYLFHFSASYFFRSPLSSVALSPPLKTTGERKGRRFTAFRASSRERR